MDHLRRSYSTSDLSDDGQMLTKRHRALQDEGEVLDDDEIGGLPITSRPKGNFKLLETVCFSLLHLFCSVHL